MPIAAALPAIIGAGSSIGSALLGRQRPQQQTSTSRSTPIYGPGQEQLMDLMNRRIRKEIKRGAEIPPWMRTQQRQQVNSVYDMMMKRLEADSARRGFGGSGIEGQRATQLERGRAGEMIDLEAMLSDQAMKRYYDLLGLGMGAVRPVGQETVSTGTLPGQSMGQALAPAIGGVGNDIATWLWMRRMQNQPSSGGYISPSIGGGAATGASQYVGGF